MIAGSVPALQCTFLTPKDESGILTAEAEARARRAVP